ncbi:Outer membrane fibronectin-binding protein [candidate division SR1 bacterium RAAC1_SR1_1]|nr:Outer membrane fibronectin-binding protein [candidate division SR1 bacterium RAAC1_SR1_1]
MEKQYTQKRYVSYEELQKKCVLLAEKIEKSGFSPNMIVSITRGGLLSAYFLADLLGVKSIETINITTHDGTVSGEIRDATKIPKDFTEFNALIVDDLIDSGKTMKYILDQYTFNPLETKIATIYCKSKATFKPDFFVEEIPAEERIVFPYER